MSDNEKLEEQLEKTLIMRALTMPRERTPDVRVNINQQPHDAADAARLYGQLQDKAKAEVVKAVKVGNTIFECVVHQELDNLSQDMRFVAIFRLNAQEMTAQIRVPMFEYRKDDNRAFELLRDEMAKVIAQRVLARSFMELVAKRFR